MPLRFNILAEFVVLPNVGQNVLSHGVHLFFGFLSLSFELVVHSIHLMLTLALLFNISAEFVIQLNDIGWIAQCCGGQFILLHRVRSCLGFLSLSFGLVVDSIHSTLTISLLFIIFAECAVVASLE